MCDGYIFKIELFITVPGHQKLRSSECELRMILACSVRMHSLRRHFERAIIQWATHHHVHCFTLYKTASAELIATLAIESVSRLAQWWRDREQAVRSARFFVNFGFIINHALIQRFSSQTLWEKLSPGCQTSGKIPSRKNGSLISRYLDFWFVERDHRQFDQKNKKCRH